MATMYLAVRYAQSCQYVVGFLRYLFDCDLDASKALSVSFSSRQIIHKFSLIKLKRTFYMYNKREIPFARRQ